MKVLFIELEVTSKNDPIHVWFPLLQEKINRRLPDYLRLEGGVYPLKDGTIHRWPGSHYFLCIPDDSFSLGTLSSLTPYGKMISCKNQTVEESTLNDKHSISYWGLVVFHPCNLYKNIRRNLYNE
jgi:hypothetical protein